MRKRNLSVLALATAFLLGSLAIGQVSTSEGIATAIPDIAPRDVGGAFWRIDGNFDAVLHLRNVLNVSDIAVTPVLWMADGTEYSLTPVTLARAGVASININDAIRHAPNQISGHVPPFGSVGIRYSWRWRDAVIAHVTSTDDINSLTYTTHLGALLKPSFENSIKSPEGYLIEGLWWQRTASTTPFVSLVNTSSSATSAHLEFTDPSDHTLISKDVFVGAKSAQLVTFLDSLVQLGQAKCGGLHISYFGSAPSLVAEGGLEDFAAGYSAPMPLMSSKARSVRHLISSASTTFAAIGIQIGKPEAKMLFPADTNFSPYTTLRNLGESPIHIKLGASYMASGPQQVSLSEVMLAGKESRQLDLSTMLGLAGLANYSGEITLRFFVDSGADSLLIASGSTAKDATYVFAVDPTIVVPESGKIFCDWQVSGNVNTMMSFWNGGTVMENAELVLSFQGGQYRYPIHLSANESSHFNLASLIAEKKPDADGRTIPSVVREGTARLINAQGRRSLMDIKAHASVFNVETATCREVCPTCNNLIYALVEPGNSGVLASTKSQFAAMVTDNAGDTYDDSSHATWSSDQTAVAAVSDVALVTGITEGAANITAHLLDEGVPSWSDGSLCNYPLPQCPRFVSSPKTPVNVGLRIATGNYQFHAVVGVNCFALLACPNGNAAATCGAQVPNVAINIPINGPGCLEYIRDSRLVSNGKCFPIGKAAQSNTPVNCN